MRIIILILSLFCLAQASFCQSRSLNFVVKNKDTKATIPYATINVSHTNKFLDTDSIGKFSILAFHSDTLVISSIGYVQGKFLISNLKSGDTILLKQNFSLLEEVIISKHSNAIFGILDKKKRQMSIIGGTSIDRLEFTTLIEIPENISSYKISKIFIRGRNFNNENPVRLHIYDVDANGLPGKELLVSEVIITNAETKNSVLVINVEDQGIFLENTSFFAGLQWISSQNTLTLKGPEIFETYKTKKLLTYKRQLSIKNNGWFATSRKTMAFFPGGFIPKDEYPENVLTSAEIEIFD